MIKNKSEIVKKGYEIPKKNDLIEKIVKKLSDEEFKVYYDDLKKLDYEENFLQNIKEKFAMKHLDLHIHKTIKEDTSSIYEIYNEEISKIERIIYRDDILGKINGLSILLYGETGTGKTSVVKLLKKRNPKIYFDFINLEEIVSSKMGQTQINLLSLIDRFNGNKEKRIIFFEELDSIIGNRIGTENSERKKITSTFIKLLDSLDNNIILIASTNHLELLDSSIIRRFNFKIQGKKINIEEFINIFDNETNSFLKRKQSKLLNIKKMFTIADLNSFINHYEIEKEFERNIIAFPEFLMFFKMENKFLDILSTREKNYIKQKRKK